jgi:hypothetical protein
MATSLYDLSVPTFLQTLSAVAGFLDRAANHCAESGADPDDFVDARLYPDMARSTSRSRRCRITPPGAWKR